MTTPHPLGNIPCFFIDRTSWAQVTYRRFATREDAPCTWHDASVVVADRVDFVSDVDGMGTIPTEEQKKDPRWPAACAQCGKLFDPSDHWQINTDRLFMTPKGELVKGHRSAPPGAMWWRDWQGVTCFDSPDHKKRGGGPHLMVMTPCGEWDIDGPATNSAGWSRVGEPPDKVTVTGSILCGKFHAHLVNGVLVRCGDSGA